MLLSGCGGDAAADMVFTNGIIYTADAEDTIAEAMAVKDGVIVFVGSAEEAKSWVGDNTEVVDLEGKMLMPGMIDGHMHAPGTALTELYNIDLNGVLRETETIEIVKAFVEENPDIEFYYGSGFSIGAFKGAEASMGPKKERLDAISADVPIVIDSYDGHTSWLNSKAFEVLGITKDTPNPPGGVIEKDPATGELWGTLRESAMSLVPVQEFTPEQELEALELFQSNLHSWGYTGLMSISGYAPPPFAAYKTLQDAGELKLRVTASYTLDPEKPLDEQFAEVDQLKADYDSDLVKLATVKFFADGVIEGVTAYLLEPYEAAAEKGSDFKGEFLWDMEKMKEAFTTANSKGLQIHVHSIGDASTRNVLDAMEYAGQNVPEGDYRNVITHLQLVDEADIPRFAELKVIASTQPYWHFKEPDWWEIIDSPFVGERAEREYPLQSFIKAGAMVVSSSDHPVTPFPNPMWAIEAGVTRNIENEEFYGVEPITDIDDPTYLLSPGERASLFDMIKSFTANAAFQIFREAEIGTIAVGKFADFVILDQNLMEIDPLRIDSVRVLQTYFNGEKVYDAEG
jgi:hypothetical protein